MLFELFIEYIQSDTNLIQTTNIISIVPISPNILTGLSIVPNILSAILADSRLVSEAEPLIELSCTLFENSSNIFSDNNSPGGAIGIKFNEKITNAVTII